MDVLQWPPAFAAGAARMAASDPSPASTRALTAPIRTADEPSIPLITGRMETPSVGCPGPVGRRRRCGPGWRTGLAGPGWRGRPRLPLRRGGRPMTTPEAWVDRDGEARADQDSAAQAGQAWEARAELDGAERAGQDGAA